MPADLCSNPRNEEDGTSSSLFVTALMAVVTRDSACSIDKLDLQNSFDPSGPYTVMNDICIRLPGPRDQEFFGGPAE